MEINDDSPVSNSNLHSWWEEEDEEDNVNFDIINLMDMDAEELTEMLENQKQEEYLAQIQQN